MAFSNPRSLELPENPEPIRFTSYDEVAVQELWQEVREFCNNIDDEIPMVPQSLPSSTPPAGPSRKSLLQHRQENGIKLRRLFTITDPDTHFISLGYQPVPLQPTESIHMDMINEAYEELVGAQAEIATLDCVNAWKIIEEFFFPHRLEHFRAPYFKVLNAAISTGEISLENNTTPLAQQHTQVEANQQAQKQTTTPKTPLRQLNPPPIPPHARSSPQGVGRSTSQNSKQSILPSSAPSSSSQLNPVQFITSQDEFLERLLPHTTFWLTRPASVVSFDLIEGVIQSRLLFPYLTIVHRAQDEPQKEVLERAALVATCILSSHVQPLRLDGIYDRMLTFLRHFVIIVDTGNLGFRVCEARPGTGLGTTYVLSIIGSGKLSHDSGRFQLWLHRIHEWAVEVWRPRMMAAFSPRYLQHNDLELKDEHPELTSGDFQLKGGDFESNGNHAQDEARRDVVMWASELRD